MSRHLTETTFANLRHRELLAEREADRTAIRLRREAKARRLQRRAGALTRRAAELVERTDG